MPFFGPRDHHPMLDGNSNNQSLKPSASYSTVQIKVILTSNLYVLLFRDGLYTLGIPGPGVQERPEPVLALRKDKFH